MTRSEVLQIAKPILFNTDMVRAILDGRKTATRRVIKPQPKMKLCYAFAGHGHGKWHYPDENVWKYWGEEFKRPDSIEDDELKRVWVPPCHTDDILYVRETWLKTDCFGLQDGYFYKANETQNSRQVREEYGFKWRPSIHMPKEAARIFLRVTDVRVERLQDITMTGMEQEGAIPPMVKGGQWEQWQREYMKPLWNGTVKKTDIPLYGWDANPWVWVIEFERVEVEL